MERQGKSSVESVRYLQRYAFDLEIDDFFLSQRFGTARSAMPRHSSSRTTYSIGQLAKRWGVSAERIRHLIRAGKLSGCFEIPSAGKYGRAIRIPIQSVCEVEAIWGMTPSISQETAKRRKRADKVLTLKHFPELASLSEPD